MFGYQQTAYNYGTYGSANGQQAAGFVGFGQQQQNAGATANTGITPMGTAANAYANSQYSLAASAYAQYSQAAQQQQAGNVTAGYGIQPPPPPTDYAGNSSGTYGVIGGGKPGGNKSHATGANAVSTHYAGYEAAVYAAASNMMHGGGGSKGSGSGNWKSGGGGGYQYQKKRYGLGHQNRDMQQFFCELCKVSCAGQAAYKDHMDGKPHKRKEQAAKDEANARGRLGFRCEVCEVTCSSKDTFDAHVKGQKHQRTIALLRRMGKPVPQIDADAMAQNVSAEAQGQPIPTVGSGGPLKKVVGVTGTKFVGGTTLLTTGEELKYGQAHKTTAVVTGAVKPQDLEKALLGNENVKPVGQEFIEEEKDSHGKFLTYVCKLCDCKFSDKGAKDVHLKGRRHRLQYKQKVDPNLKVETKLPWGSKSKTGPLTQGLGAFNNFQPPPQQGRPLYPMPRNQEVMDDKHVIHKMQQIQLSGEEMNNVERLAFFVEKTLKIVSDGMIKAGEENQPAEQERVLKGVMRVGLLAKQLLLKGDKQIDLVVLCSKIPTVSLLKEVAELFKKSAELSANEELTVEEMVDESSILISLSTIPSFECRMMLTSVSLREGNQATEGTIKTEEQTLPTDPLPKDPCLNALAELRHAKYYQVKCAPVHSLNMTVKIVRDISTRVRTWAPLHCWALELLVEKSLASIAMPLSPGDALRRLFEVISSGVFLSKRSKLVDPCEKEPVDVLGHISDQEREDITSSAQHALRLIAYNQIYKILVVDRLPDARPPAAGVLVAGSAAEASEAKKGKLEEKNDQDEPVKAEV